MKSASTLIVLLAAMFGRPAAANAQSAAGLDLTWNTVDSGGVMRSTGGGFELSGTIGQIDAGRSGNGGLELTGGFWFELVPADCNEDGSVTIFDFTDFIACLIGPDESTAIEPQCECFDLDGSDTVDLLDFAEFQAGFSGP